MEPSTLWCRSPYGERGLKFRCLLFARALLGRSPYGERGLKYRYGRFSTRPVCRSPYGERGLKYADEGDFAAASPSLSLRRAWIEIIISRPSLLRLRRSPYGERGLK